ncbi:MAG: hypothetical protein HYW88_03300 [Candidatus Sungbacteria bacterium]|nr:hypothetical protein [Candidatus Sungbacteria bacterium]
MKNLQKKKKVLATRGGSWRMSFFSEFARSFFLPVFLTTGFKSSRVILTTMNHGEYKKILYDIFSALEFSEADKEKALEDFKKRLAGELWLAVKKEMKDVPAWAEDLQSMTDPNDPRLPELRKALFAQFSKEDLAEKSRPLFKKILEEYVLFVSADLEQSSRDRLYAIVNEF